MKTIYRWWTHIGTMFIISHKKKRAHTRSHNLIRHLKCIVYREKLPEKPISMSTTKYMARMRASLKLFRAYPEPNHEIEEKKNVSSLLLSLLLLLLFYLFLFRSIHVILHFGTCNNQRQYISHTSLWTDTIMNVCCNRVSRIASFYSFHLVTSFCIKLLVLHLLCTFHAMVKERERESERQGSEMVYPVSNKFRIK